MGAILESVVHFIMCPWSISVQTSPKGIVHSSKRCDVYRGDHREITKANKTTLLSIKPMDILFMLPIVDGPPI